MTSGVETAAARSTNPWVHVRAASLEVIAGPDAGRRVRLDRPTFVVGKGEGCDLRLTDTTVSREHVRLALTPHGILVSDEGSKNGTISGAFRIHKVLVSGDTTLTLGSTTLLLRIDTGDLKLEISERQSFGDAFGVSTAMRHVFATLERVASSTISVLLEGESGVGKDVLARAVHAASPRSQGPFVAVDCGAIPRALIESELFGHVRGAFTGADTAREGLFQQSDGGTLFLDELGELPLDLQPKLLRALETREVCPIGGQPQLLDLRIIAATNRRLSEAVHREEFRSDLFYRVAGVRVIVPPLRDRPEDITPLAVSFLRKATKDPARELPPFFAALLSSYAFPGNVRELRNIVERYAVLGDTNPNDLFDEQLAKGLAIDAAYLDAPFHDARQRLLDRFERAYLTHALEACAGILVRVVEKTGIPRPTLYRMMTRLGIARSAADEP